MTLQELSRADARRIAVRAQLLDSPRPTGLLEVVRHLTLLQVDPTAAIAGRLGGDRLVGKLDTTADRDPGVLRVDAVHQDVPFDQTMTAAVHAEIEDLARWLELDLALPPERPAAP